MTMKILAVGDVCGEPGLAFLDKRLKSYRKENGIDFVVVNGENANVVGITPKQADAILRSAPARASTSIRPTRATCAC